MTTNAGGLGRREPLDRTHEEKYPVRAVGISGVSNVNLVMELPYFHWEWDQGQEGACVGFGGCMTATVRNLYDRRVKGVKPYTHRYDPWWLWNEAKKIDPWPDTNPGDHNGTSVAASMDVMRTQGLIKVDGRSNTPNIAYGIESNHWARTVDEMRACIARHQPISIGVDWHTNFDRPQADASNEYWIGRGDWAATTVRGGHCVCVYGASDRRQAFRIKNSWGRSYPLVWLPYSTMQTLLDRGGEATIITDR